MDGIKKLEGNYCSAGVWRRVCIESVGGWNGRTTVEDMDLSLRAYLAGWRSLFLEDTTCLNEVRKEAVLLLLCLLKRTHSIHLHNADWKNSMSIQLQGLYSVPQGMNTSVKNQYNAHSCSGPIPTETIV